MTEPPITVTIARDNLRHFVGGFLLCGIIAVVWWATPEAPDPAVVRADSVVSRITRSYVESQRDDRRKTAKLAGLRASADSARLALRRPSATITTLGTELANLTVAPVVPSDTADTTKMVGMLRPSDQRVFPIPLFLVEQMRSFIAYTDHLEETYAHEHAARAFAVDTLVPDIRRQLVFADSVIGAQRVAIDARDRARHPRCGKKCGIAIGVGVVIATAVVVNEVRGLLPSQRGIVPAKHGMLSFAF